MTTTPQPEPQSRTGLKTWKLTLAYDGTDYSGWQVQPGQPTIQGELQGALGRVTGEAPLPQGSGRTDAGVHALAQVASFALQAAIPEENLKRALNRTLPAAIRVMEARVVAEGFHARHSTAAKTYEYRVFLQRPGQGDEAPVCDTLCPPFLARYVYTYPWPMDFGALEKAAEAFVGTYNFLSFAATDPALGGREGEETELASEPKEYAPPNPVRTVFSSVWEQRQIEEGALLVYRVRGSGFLHHMVRNLVGTMLDVGRGYRSAGEIPAMIEARARAAAGPTAPARGLFLHSVEYRDELER